MPTNGKAPEAKPIQNSITVVEMAYLQSQNLDTECVESRFSRPIESPEQLYKRRIFVTKEWKPLKTGWIEEAGMLIISNEEGKNLSTNPTEDEKQEIASKIIEVSSSISASFALLIPPEESMRIMPSDASLLCIRCKSGNAMAIINAFPK